MLHRKKMGDMAQDAHGRLHNKRRWRWLPTVGGISAVVVWGAIAYGHTPAHTQRGEPLPLRGRWIPTTLGAVVNVLATVPGTTTLVVAGTDNGVWRSTDSGTTWRHDRSSPPNNIFTLAASTDGTIYAGGSDGRVYTYTGTARTSAGWRPISPPLTTTPIFSVAASVDKRTLLVGSTGVLYRGTVDGGRWRWRLVRRTTDAATVTSITRAPWDARLAFATMFEVAPPVLISHDDGRTWRPDVIGLPSALPTQSLRIGNAGTHQVFLSTMGGGVWRRTAAGSWHDVSAGLPQRHAMPLITVPASDVLYAGTMGYGVYEKQGGALWRHLGQGLSGPRSIVLSLAEAAGPRPALLAGTAGGLLRYAPAR